MKQILIFSLTLVVLLNVWQFLSTQKQRADAFAPSWAMASSQSGTPKATPVPTKTAGTTPVMADTVAVPAVVADPVATAATKLTAAGLKPDYAAAYIDAANRTGTPWQLLAAVHQTETGQSGDTSRASYAGAVGPMQFMPATFRAYATDGDGNGTATITSLSDSLVTAGRYLAADGAASGNYQGALYHYNHSNTYVSHVLGIAHRLGL